MGTAHFVWVTQQWIQPWLWSDPQAACSLSLGVTGVKGKLCDNVHQCKSLCIAPCVGRGPCGEKVLRQMSSHCRDNNVCALYVAHTTWLVAFCQGLLLTKWLLDIFYSHPSVLHQWEGTRTQAKPPKTQFCSVLGKCLPGSFQPTNIPFALLRHCGPDLSLHLRQIWVNECLRCSQRPLGLCPGGSS